MSIMKNLINKGLLIAVSLSLFVGSAESIESADILKPMAQQILRAVPPEPARNHPKGGEAPAVITAPAPVSVVSSVPPPPPQRQRTPNPSAPHIKKSEGEKAKAPSLPIVQGEKDGANPATTEKINDTISKINGTAHTQIVYDDDYQAVKISLKDVTRLVCFTDITKTVYSKEKNMEIETDGRDAFIKNLASKTADPLTGQPTIRYDTRPKELYVMCGARTFSLILVPDDVRATTIYLKSTQADKSKAAAFEASDYENTLYKLMKAAYNEDIPDGYEVEEIDKPQGKFKEGTMVHRRNYSGDMFQVNEFIFISNEDVNLDELQVLEVLKYRNTLAVSIVDNILAPNQQTRIFLVRTNHE